MYIQSTFSNATEVLIRQKFNISNEERLISAVWLSINRTGFVFTDRNCYWNVKATIQKDDNKSTLPKITSISNKNAQDMQVNLNFKRKSHKQKETFACEWYYHCASQFFKNQNKTNVSDEEYDQTLLEVNHDAIKYSFKNIICCRIFD